MGPLSEKGSAPTSNELPSARNATRSRTSRRGGDGQGVAMVGRRLVPAEVAGTRGAHRRHGRHGRHRLLRGPPRCYPPVLGPSWPATTCRPRSAKAVMRHQPPSPGHGRCRSLSASELCSAPFSCSVSLPMPKDMAPTPPSQLCTTTRGVFAFGPSSSRSWLRR
jgi:hypothetical protein